MDWEAFEKHKPFAGEKKPSMLRRRGGTKNRVVAIRQILICFVVLQTHLVAELQPDQRYGQGLQRVGLYPLLAQVGSETGTRYLFHSLIVNV